MTRCPKCNARGSWLQKIGWDNTNKVWEYGCVLCGWRPTQRPRPATPNVQELLARREYAKGA
jgi:hypothetical protein